jgi:CHAD domain-containing protein
MTSKFPRKPQSRRSAVALDRRNGSKFSDLPSRTDQLKTPRKIRPIPAAIIPIVEASASQFELAWKNILEADFVEGAHKFRVACRKLRVLLHALRRCDASGHLQKVRQSLGRASRLVGGLRDLDVLSGEIVAPLSGPASPAGIGDLKQQIVAWRDEKRVKVCAELQSVESDTLRRDCSELGGHLRGLVVRNGRRAGRGEKASLRKFARRDLLKRWHAFATLAQTVDAAPLHDLHESRKLLKSLRYATSHFATCFPEEHLAAFQKRAAKLQDAFGYINDVEQARSMFERLSKDTEPGPSCAISEAAGFVLGVHSERARRARLKLGPCYRRLAAVRLIRTLDRDS